MKIGIHQLASANQPALILAPMAGVTDLPFRKLCRKWGADLAVSEMISANPKLKSTRKSQLRRLHDAEPAPISVQIAGFDPAQMAECAQENVDQGAQIIDINMGCPAKKVCARESGSALLRDESQVARILEAVVHAVNVPVTLKIRTGFSRAQKNGVNIARIAERAGIHALAVHGRTREDLFAGQAEYDTIAEIKQTVNIPVFANGDICTPEQAALVLRQTGCDGLLIGRAAQGRPWIFQEIRYFLENEGATLPPLSRAQIGSDLLAHLNALYDFYGEVMGVRIARKHIQWRCQNAQNLIEHDFSAFWQRVSRLDSAEAQYQAVGEFFG